MNGISTTHALPGPLLIFLATLCLCVVCRFLGTAGFRRAQPRCEMAGAKTTPNDPAFFNRKLSHPAKAREKSLPRCFKPGSVVRISLARPARLRKEQTLFLCLVWWASGCNIIYQNYPSSAPRMDFFPCGGRRQILAKPSHSSRFSCRLCSCTR